MNLKKINNPFGGLIYYKESTTSTMVEAKSLLAEENCHGVIFLTDFQTTGVGRLQGRTWKSNKGENLMFTLILDKDKLGHGYITIPLKVGLALSKAITRFTDLDPKVKWPNDVFINNKKISGILCQSNRQSILVGVGLNVNQLEFPEELKNKATSLSLITNNGYNLEMVLSTFLEELYTVLKAENWLEEMNKSLYLQGEDVTFAIGDPKNNNIVKGKLVGLDKNGKVIIESNNGEKNSYISGEFIL